MSITRKEFLLTYICVLFASLLFSDVGVIIPLEGGRDKPDQSILSIYRMEINILIDNNYATVKVMQIFHNHTNRDLEGQYVFIVPSEAAISDFAIWDNQVRIPGVVMEKKRARRIYEETVWRMKDPGLLETTDDASQMHHFKARIYPIPAGGTKRLEMEYTQKLDMSRLRTYFNFPLKPTYYKPQRCSKFKVNVVIESNHNLRDFKKYYSKYPIEIKSNEPGRMVLAGEGRDVLLDENISFEYSADVEGMHFDYLTFRNADRYVYDPDPYHGYKYRDKSGYIFTSIIYNLTPAAKVGRGRDIVVLLDISLSMQWKRLEQAYSALEYFLKNLNENDRLQVIVFNDDVKMWKPKPMPYSAKRAQEALDFVKSCYLTGGTDLLGAVRAGLTQIRDNPHVSEPYLVVITDGHPTKNELRYKEIEGEINRLNSEWKRKKGDKSFLAHLYIYGIGDKTNVALLERLVNQSDGFFTWVSDTETADFKLQSFLAKIGSDLISDISLDFEQGQNIDMIYPPGKQKAFNGTAVDFIGRYKKPIDKTKLTVTGRQGGKDIKRDILVELPERAIKHAHLPRMWARARVDRLLELINFEGEKKEWISEVIALSKQYKFITPYTSFLAAPRSLLRPRVIKPGDPVLRVKTDPAIVAVTASFPFNLVKPMRYIEDEDIWEVRFLAPKEMNDGEYQCRLLLKSKDGIVYKEKKRFVIDSKPPRLYPSADKEVYRAGETIKLKVRADADTRRLRARLGVGLPVSLWYDPKVKACTGEIKIPEDTATGNYKIILSAVDFAHNNSTAEITVKIIGE